MPEKFRSAASVRNGPVSFQPMSTNKKLSPTASITHDVNSRFKRPMARGPYCASTYVSIAATCPDTCTFKNRGCYVQSGITGARARVLDHAADGMTGDEVMALEAELIDKQWVHGVPQDGAKGGRDLRLHVGGDVSSETGAQLLAGAAGRWLERGGGTVWTYTHRWAEIPAKAWGPIQVFASCESPQDALRAAKAGYYPSLTVGSFEDERRHMLGRLPVIPCPAQTRGRTCVECRLCLDRAQHGVAIGFQLHGVKRHQLRRRLQVAHG
jgi:hypothetical protein